MPLSASDRVAITEVIARYCHGTDTGDGQSVADQFTVDGILEIAGSWQARGREQIKQVGDFPNKPKHWVSGIVIEGTGSTASATTYYAAVGNGGPLYSTGIYESQLTKQLNGQWKLLHHRYTGDPVVRSRPVPASRRNPEALTVEDRLAIMELVARYNRALSTRDADAAAAAFAEDGVLETTGQADVRGRAAVAQTVRALPVEDAHYWTTNFIIEGHTNEAISRAYFALLRGNQVASTGQYVDTVTKIEGEWRIARHQLSLDTKAK
jgi:uncharacterized protein (TIGR02246 family)